MTRSRRLLIAGPPWLSCNEKGSSGRAELFRSNHRTHTLALAIQAGGREHSATADSSRGTALSDSV